MKILHTADLHLGKRLNKASRLDEQNDVIIEIAELAESEDVDVILIAGDVFDTSVPTAEAERAFYRALITFAKQGRAVIVLAGNHDDERRMCAAKPLADLLGIVLAGELDYSKVGAESLTDTRPPATLYELADAADFLQKQRTKLIGHYGGVTVVKDEERVNIALVPYPAEARLARWEPQDYNVSYEERIKNTLIRACEFFDENYNILCTHLFLSKSQSAEALGGVLALPVEVLPEKADYVALGHVHKHFRVSKTPLAEYSGSPLQYAYDEGRNKTVNIIDTQKRSVSPVMIKAGKRLIETEADNFDECMVKLDEHKADYVRLKYGGDPLAKEEAAKIRSHPAFNDLVITANLRGTAVVERKAHLSDCEIFEMYYKHRDKNHASPSAELKAAFVSLMNELKGEAAHETD